MTDPLIPATLEFLADGTLFSRLYDDVYHSVAGGLAQSEFVFLKGNGLPERWQRRRVFTVVETGFGTGINFLATWAAWRRDAARCERLHFVSVEKHPVRAADLRRAHAATIADPAVRALAGELADAWPTLVPGMQRLEFEGGRVTLTLAFGDALDMLPALSLRADAFYLDGFSPAKNPELWTPAIFKALARMADIGATFSTWSSSGEVKRGMQEAGFSWRKVDGFGFKRTMLVGEFAPPWRVRRYEPPAAIDVDERRAVVIGGGLAGCALVERLAARGWHVTLLERHAALARDASGNPAGVFHPMISRDDSVASRITRAGFLYALSRWDALQRSSSHAESSLAGRALATGLLHIAASDDEAQLFHTALASFGYPDDFVIPVSPDEARRIAGTEVTRGGWFYPRGGSVSPAAICAAQCDAAGERLERRFNVQVDRIERDGSHWAVYDSTGQLAARAPVVIVASAHDAARIAGLHHAATRIVRGQLTLMPPGSVAALAVPVIGEGYAVPLANGTTLIGATYEVDDDDPAIRSPGHIENIERVGTMLPGFAAAADQAAPEGGWEGRVAFRCVTSDRIPMLGQLADETIAFSQAQQLRGAWPRDLPRAPGLFGAFAYGSRGLVWSTLGAELIASQLEGEPWPIERELAEAMDPARYLLRVLRQRKAD